MALTKVGRYDIIRLVGRSPRAECYLAEDRGDGRKVTIRLFRADSASQEQFLEQARKVAALSHPNIAVSQVGLHEDEAFVATEYLPGSNLVDWLKKSHSLSDQLMVIAGIAEALNHAHEQGVLHRALKPTNVQVLPDGHGVLMDFGPGPEGSAKSSPAAAYLAPEVLHDGPYTQKSDIYSAGVLLYEVLAGQNPFLRDTPAASAAAVLSVQPPPLGDVRKDMKRDLTDAIMACLEKDPDWRPKDLTYIIELVRGLGTASAPKGGRTPAKSAAPAAAPGFGARRSEAPSRLPLMLGAGVLLAAVAAGAWFFLRPGKTGATTQAGGATGGTKATPPPTPAPVETPAEVAASQAPTPSTRPAAPSPTPRTPPSTLVAVVAPVSIAPSSLAPARATPPPPTTLAVAPTPETVRPVPTLAPTPPPASARTAPTPEPALIQPAVAQEPAVLKTVVPAGVKRSVTGILDVHGTGLRPDHRAVVMKGHDAAKGFSVVRQRLVSPGLLQVVMMVDESVPPGSYALALTDAEGHVSNSLRIEVAK